MLLGKNVTEVRTVSFHKVMFFFPWADVSEEKGWVGLVLGAAWAVVSAAARGLPAACLSDMPPPYFLEGPSVPCIGRFYCDLSEPRGQISI